MKIGTKIEWQRTNGNKTAWRRITLTAVFLILTLLPTVSGQTLTDPGEVDKQAARFVGQWEKLLADEAATATITVVPEQKEHLAQTLAAWRQARSAAGAGNFTVSGKGGMHWPDTLYVVMSARAASGKDSAPATTGFTIDLTNMRQPVVLDINTHPWLPTPLLLVCFCVLTLYLLFPVLAMILGRKAHDESLSWGKRQFYAFMVNLALIPCVIAFNYGQRALDDNGLWFTWQAHVFNGDPYTFASSSMLAFICLNLVVVGIYCWTLWRQRQKYLDRFRRNPAQPRTLWQRLIGPQFIQVVVIIVAIAVWTPVLIKFWDSPLYFMLLLLTMCASAVLLALGVMMWWLRGQSDRCLDGSNAIVKEALRTFAKTKAGVAIRKIYVLPEYEWPLPNAFVIGLGRKSCMIGVTEPLLEKLTPVEVTAVLLHEYAHFWERHLLMQFTVLLLTAIGCAFTFFNLPQWMQSLGLPYPASIFDPLNVLVSLVIMSFCMPILFTLLSRFCERRADKLVRDLGQGAALATALQKMSDSAHISVKWPRWVRWISTHPSFEERLSFLKTRMSMKPQPVVK